MLSPNTLNRVSHSYRKGYYAGYEAGENATSDPQADKTFAAFDYSEGFRAGQNDRKWDDIRRRA